MAGLRGIDLRFPRSKLTSVPADDSVQPQPREPAEHQDRSGGEPRRGVLAFLGQGREGTGSREAVRALEGVSPQVRALQRIGGAGVGHGGLRVLLSSTLVTKAPPLTDIP